MKRQLTKEERKLTKAGIKNRQTRIDEQEQRLQYMLESNQFHKKWADYLEVRRLKQVKLEKQIQTQTMKELKDIIEFEKEALKKESKHLTDGIEVRNKIPVGVN